ncbi:MAG: hypothetical protein WA496_10600 [Candidatus Udaeobacter sp.]
MRTVAGIADPGSLHVVAVSRHPESPTPATVAYARERGEDDIRSRRSAALHP